jgi:hypothetical protein
MVKNSQRFSRVAAIVVEVDFFDDQGRPKSGHCIVQAATVNKYSPGMQCNLNYRTTVS